MPRPNKALSLLDARVALGGNEVAAGYASASAHWFKNITSCLQVLREEERHLGMCEAPPAPAREGVLLAGSAPAYIGSCVSCTPTAQPCAWGVARAAARTSSFAPARSGAHLRPFAQLVLARHLCGECPANGPQQPARRPRDNAAEHSAHRAPRSLGGAVPLLLRNVGTPPVPMADCFLGALPQEATLRVLFACVLAFSWISTSR